MSRAFVNEDAGEEVGPDYRLPDPDSPYFAEAAAWALIQGADAGDTRSAEDATGCRWGEPALVTHIESILEKAVEDDNLRVEQLCRRFLRASKRLD